MLAYITNSLHTFSLGPEEIIYLADIGLSSGVVTAMLKHDRAFIENASIPSPTPPAPEPTALPAERPAEPETVADAAQYPTEAPVSEPTEPDFHDALAPYGTWVDVGGYGRCWQPSVVTINPDWRPYCDRGHWVYSDCGWYWLSDYSWGWAPFHYGRWFHHNHLGWCWSPGRVWGPSWVSWRYSGDYCGWAPLPPIASFRPGLGFFCGGLSVGLNFDFGIAASCYTFVPVKNFCDYRLRRFALPGEHVARIFNQTVVANNIVSEHNRIINHGIAAERVAAATHIPLRPVAVREANAPASPGLRAEQLEAGGRALSVYRPHWDQHPRTPPTIAGQSGTQTLEPAPVSGINGSATSGSLRSQREPARGSGTIRLPGAQAQYASPSSPAGSRRTDPGASRGVARTEPVNSPLSNVRSENIAKAEPATARPTTTAPLIIRGPGRTGTPSSDATQRHVSRFAASQNSQPFGAPSQSQSGRTSVWASSRFPQGQENQDSNRNRDQFESRLMTTPSALAARAYYLPN